MKPMMGPLRMMRFYREHRWTRRNLSEYVDGELDDGPGALSDELEDRAPRGVAEGGKSVESVSHYSP